MAKNEKPFGRRPKATGVSKAQHRALVARTDRMLDRIRSLERKFAYFSTKNLVLVTPKDNTVRDNAPIDGEQP